MCVHCTPYNVHSHPPTGNFARLSTQRNQFAKFQACLFISEWIIYCAATQTAHMQCCVLFWSGRDFHRWFPSQVNGKWRGFALILHFPIWNECRRRRTLLAMPFHFPLCTYWLLAVHNAVVASYKNGVLDISMLLLLSPPCSFIAEWSAVEVIEQRHLIA